MATLSRSRQNRFALIAALTACAVLGLMAATAEGKRLGQLAPSCDVHCPLPPAGLQQQGIALHTAASSPSYRVPRGRWKIRSWRVQPYSTYTALARLLVYRPAAKHGRYKLIAESDQGIVSGGVVPTFKSAIRVRRGDRLGLAASGPLKLDYPTPAPTDKAATFPCAPAPGDAIGTGSVCPLTPTSGRRINLAARIRRIR